MWGKIPPRNKNFTGRVEHLARLRSNLTADVTAVVPHALHGMGGVGKTQMAVEYAYRTRGDYDLVWWVPADQPMLARSSLAALAPELGLPGASMTGIEDAANSVLGALRRGQPYDRWLLIFDNADQPEDINEMVPRGPGHVLITSRNHRWEGIVDTVSVDVFTREESVEFLGKRVPRSMTAEYADRLSAELGDLPLALEQAGALVNETGMTVNEYLELLHGKTSQLLLEGKPLDYPMSMTAAWSISVANLSQKVPEAVELLRCCAFFGPEPIPRDVFRPSDAALGTGLGTLLSDPIMLSRAIGELNRYALIRIDTVSRTIGVHRLIQALVRDELSEDEGRRVRADVHQLLVGALPDNPDEAVNWSGFENLVAHLEPTGVGDSRDPAVRGLALDMVRYLFLSGDLPSARHFVEQFIRRWTEISGEDDADVLRAYREQGNIIRDLGDYRSAYDLNQRTLAAMRTNGLPDEDVYPLINSVGADLRARGDFREALQHDTESLAAHEAAFGRSDARTLRVINNLALDYSLNSRFADAMQLYQEAYVAADRTGGAIGATFILGTWNGLARATRLNGEYGKACDLSEEALAYGRNLLGVEHPWTLRTSKDLAIAWRRFGELDRAQEVSRDVHARCVRLYGLDHPDTLAAAMSLANVMRNSGDEEEGLRLAADTVQRYRKVYGADHPYTLACTGNQALLLRVTSALAEARQLNRRALDRLVAQVGADHHYSLTVATNLASDHAALGQMEEARSLGEDTVVRLRRLVGEDHPMTLACAANLSADLKELGRTDDAAELFDDVRRRYERTLPLEHPDIDVFNSRRHLDLDFDPPPI
ncbi:tetratricopeptide repeat protein [Actinomadura sp. LD22]|uniref:Tetratricopeptide repeat protein n=1 Tax=Actinomadura physcomitrii TaxID=2650748 RepID=A0A6I4MJI0_9ACTN|nr:tetratricopeptide repeat protein [Actinomadura physcomitrii]